MFSFFFSDIILWNAFVMRETNDRPNEITNEHCYDLLVEWHKIQSHVHMYKLEYNNYILPFLSVAFCRIFFSFVQCISVRYRTQFYNSSFSVSFVSQNIHSSSNMTLYLLSLVLSRAFPFYILITIFNKFSTLSYIRNSHKDVNEKAVYM